MDEELYQTFEELEAELIAVEDQLGSRLSLLKPFRESLIGLDKANELMEDEVVWEWQRLYCTYADWIRWKERNK